jgi:hypothetical protein
MSFDSGRGVSVLFGGLMTSSAVSNETWEWDGAAWTLRAVAGPSARHYHGAAYDSSRAVTVLFGGFTGAAYKADTWEWNGAAWTERTVSGPSARYGHALAYDSARGVTVLFGGSTDSTQAGYNDETWEWDGSSWTQRLVTGPSARRYHAMAYDSARGVTVLFGGLTSSGATSSETWEWNGAAWSLNATTTTGAYNHAMAFDADRAQVVRFGGAGSLISLLGIGCDSPAFAAQPVDRVACSGNPAAFAVAPMGSNPFTYQWQVRASSGPWQDLGPSPTTLSCGGVASITAPGTGSVQIAVTRCPSENHYQVRCILSNACGSVTSSEAGLIINSADFNGDGDLGTDADLHQFFDCLSGNCCTTCGSADFNGDGDVGTDEDIEAFFRVLAGGPC